MIKPHGDRLLLSSPASDAGSVSVATIKNANSATIGLRGTDLMMAHSERPSQHRPLVTSFSAPDAPHPEPWTIGGESLTAGQETVPLSKEPHAPYRLAAVLTNLACLVRGGHRWKRVTDPAGSVVYCRRCGRLRHPRPSPADIHHQGHGNLGYKVTLRHEPGADVTDDRE